MITHRVPLDDMVELYAAFDKRVDGVEKVFHLYVREQNSNNTVRHHRFSSKLSFQIHQWLVVHLPLVLQTGHTKSYSSSQSLANRNRVDEIS